MDQESMLMEMILQSRRRENLKVVEEDAQRPAGAVEGVARPAVGPLRRLLQFGVRRRETLEAADSPRIGERRRFSRSGPRVEPRMRISSDPELHAEDRGLIGAIRRMVGR